MLGPQPCTVEHTPLPLCVHVAFAQLRPMMGEIDNPEGNGTGIVWDTAGHIVTSEWQRGPGAGNGEEQGPGPEPCAGRMQKLEGRGMKEPPSLLCPPSPPASVLVPPQTTTCSRRRSKRGWAAQAVLPPRVPALAVGGSVQDVPGASGMLGPMPFSCRRAESGKAGDKPLARVTLLTRDGLQKSYAATLVGADRARDLAGE